MQSSYPSGPFVARRGLCLEVFGMKEAGPASPPPPCYENPVSPAFFNGHRHSVNSAYSQDEKSQADTPTYARSPVGSMPDDAVLSQEDTRDAFPSNRDDMCVDNESFSFEHFSMSEEPERKKRSTKRRSSSFGQEEAFSPRPKSEDFNCIEQVSRLSVESQPQFSRCKSWGPETSADVDIQDRKKLRTSSSCGSVAKIEAATVAEILRQDPAVRDLYDHVYVIDCRYAYEFEGGHISQASDGDWVSVHNFAPHQVQEATQFLFESQGLMVGNDRICIIFHCEFSQKRGPAMFEKMRSHDRTSNIEQYPKLYFPEMYVMEGGYKNFYESGHQDLCEPQTYVPETHPEFSDQCKYFHRLARTKSGRKGHGLLCPAPAHISPLR